MPLWASSPPPAGGLGFTPQSLAPPLVAGGAAVLAFTLFAYPPAVARVGLEASCSAGFAATLIACAALPACAWLPGGGAQAAGLAAALCVRGAGAVAVFTAAMLLVNSNAPPGQLGEVNGAGQARGRSRSRGRRGARQHHPAPLPPFLPPPSS